MNVEQLMCETVHTCSPSSTLGEAARIMWEADCGCVPVIDENARLCGIITDRDVCMATYMTGNPPHEIFVRDAMHKQVLVCRLGDKIADAEAIMRMGQVRRLPVLDPAGRLAGLLSLNDIAVEAGRSPKSPSNGVRLDEVGLTLSAVSYHRNSGRTNAGP